MITIGKMSLACHVSIKTLRHYERIGLLQPASIDKNSGYRYYAADQIETMILISRYKRFGFSLSEIAELLKAGPEEKEKLLLKQERFLSSQIEELQMARQDLRVVIERLEKKEEDQIMNQYSVDVQNVPVQPVYSKRKIMGVGDFGTAYGELFKEMGEKGLRPFGLTGSRYYDPDFDHEASDIEVFITMEKPEEANNSIGGSLMAHTVHQGGYSSLNEAYAAIVKWMEENGYEGAGAPYELYTRNGFDRLPPDKWETDVFFPICKKQ